MPRSNAGNAYFEDWSRAIDKIISEGWRELPEDTLKAMIYELLRTEVEKGSKMQTKRIKKRIDYLFKEQP